MQPLPWKSIAPPITLGTGFGKRMDTDSIRTETEIQALIRANLIAALSAAKGKVSGPAGAAALLDMRPTTVFSRIRSFGVTDTDWE